MVAGIARRLQKKYVAGAGTRATDTLCFPVIWYVWNVVKMWSLLRFFEVIVTLLRLKDRGSIRTVHAPCQVFEQLLPEMVYRERSCRWYLVGSEALPFPLIGSG